MNRQPSFVKEIAHALRQRCHIKRDSRLLVAVSGGADSVALLHAMTGLAKKRGWGMSLAVGHVNHQLRAASAEESQFVEALARQLGLPFFDATLVPPASESGAEQAENQRAENIEKWARQARYAALQKMAMTFNASAVVVAHHADDQLETMLMRLMRGSGVQGLAGMKWRRRLARDSDVQLLRPMLGVTHQHAMDFLTSLNQLWREDHTNQDGKRVRAALRATVLPLMKQLSPALAQRVMHTSDHLHAVNHLLKAEITQERKNHVTRSKDAVRYDRPAARSTKQAVLQGLLRELLLDSGVPADSLRRDVVIKLAAAMRDNDGSVRQFGFANRVKATLDRTTLTISGGQ